MKVLILAGGSGTRLWPLSRKNYPKQFLHLNGNKSLLQFTVERFLPAAQAHDIVVMTNSDYKFHVQADLQDVFAAHNLPPDTGDIILESANRNTAPAIALGIKYCMEKLGCNEEEVIFISPSDHIIQPVDRFVEYIKKGEAIARQGYIVTFGIKPDKPETGYGYIKSRSQKPVPAGFEQGAEDSRQNFFEVEKFTEKPDVETARRYIEEGNYYWNSGMFVFSIGAMLEEFGKYAPAIKRMLDMPFDDMAANFHTMPEISIDYAVAEKSDRVAMLPIDVCWNDIGSWDSLYDVLDKDENGNIKRGDILAIDTKNSLIFGTKRHISTIGMENCIIVETDDAILIAQKGESQKVKNIVGRLKEDVRTMADEHVTVRRPWGSYTVLEEGPNYKIKKIVVRPKAKLSLQMHNRRSEHWVVVKGTAKVTVGDRDMLVSENESTYIPKSTVHRLENQGSEPLEIIEVQNGDYVGEDDIVRIDDCYGRLPLKKAQEM